MPDPRVSPDSMRLLLAPVAILLVGVALIALAAGLDGHDNPAWKLSVLVPDAPLPEQNPILGLSILACRFLSEYVPEGRLPLYFAREIIPVRVRRLSNESTQQPSPFLEQLREMPEGDELIRQFGLDKPPYVVCASLPKATLRDLLASGRVPTPGALEALAGDLARLESFVLDGRTFRVVGRLQRRCAALACACLILDDDTVQPFFSPEKEATTGWIAPGGIDAHPGLFDPDSGPQAVGGFARSKPGIGVYALLGLIGVALGGSLAQVYLLRRASIRHDGPLTAALRDIAARPHLLGFVHVSLYGVFFVLMIAAFRYPLANLHVNAFVRNEFAQGSLSYIGDAYQSGDILRASAATFTHNFFVATVALTILPSLVVPFAGMIKSLLSFAMAGFAMAPIWAGTAQHFVYHSITMTLEMEAYILATFVCVALPIRTLRGLLTRQALPEFLGGLQVVGSGAVLAAIMLAVAAFYEAATLVLFRSLT